MERDNERFVKKINNKKSWVFIYLYFRMAMTLSEDLTAHTPTHAKDSCLLKTSVLQRRASAEDRSCVLSAENPASHALDPRTSLKNSTS